MCVGEENKGYEVEPSSSPTRKRKVTLLMSSNQVSYACEMSIHASIPLVDAQDTTH